MTSDHIWYLQATGTPCGTHGSTFKTIKIHGKDNQNANTVPDNAVEAT